MRIRLWLSALVSLIFYAIFAAHAASISVSSSVENVSYDLGFMKLSLEKIASNMRVSPTIEGKLLIEDVNAQRLVITMVEDPPPSKPSAGLPDKINLPLVIRVKAARIAEVVIISGDDTQTLNDVAFNLEADEANLKLELVKASTPWGEVSSNLAMKNAKPFSLEGHARITQTKANTPYDLDLALGGNLQQLQFSTMSLLSKQGKHYALVLADAEIEAADQIARIVVSGNLGLEGDMPLAVQAQLLSTKQGSANSPNNMLDLAMQINGTLSPQPRLSGQLQAKDSYWRGEALQLDATANLIGSVIQQIRLNATLKNNTLSANGSLGVAAEPLIWQAKFDDLTALDSTLAGKLNVQGKLSQADEQLQLSMDWLGEQLQIANSMQIRKLSGKANVSNAKGSQLNVDINLEDTSLQKSGRFNAQMTLRGTPEQHQIELKSTGANDISSKNQLQAGIVGSLTADEGWQATLDRLDYQGDKPIKLEQSASLLYNDKVGFQLKHLVLQFIQGRLYLDQLQTGSGQFSSQGRIAGIGLEALPGLLLTLPSNMHGNPVFSGAWDIHATDQANGQALLELESGDISITIGDGSIKTLGLRSFVTKLLIQENRITASSEASGTQLGELNAKLSTILSQTSSGLAIANDAPLEISANAALNTLLWVPLPESMAGAAMDGQLTVNLEGRGTFAKPNLIGAVTGKQLSLTIPSEGVNLSNGMLEATFSNDQLVIKQAKFQGGDGFLSATGSLQLTRGKPELSLNWQAENFTAASRTDRLIVIGGKIDTRLSSNLLEVSGQVDILRGLILLADEDKPSLSDDVVIVGREIEVDQNPLLMKVSDLRIGIGNSGRQFVLRGRGLDSTLVGRITLNGMPNQSLRAEGTITAAGTYMAYGQVLNIERGQLNFSGPVDNPGLNILALRQNLAVRAGVEIRGNVLNPTVKLVSIPEVSDSDKLSWLVLGHGIDQAGQDQFAMLSLAAGALLSQGQSVPLQTRFARAAGLDSFNVGGSSAESTSISLGKRLASNLYLTYEKEVTGLLNVARLTYDITSRWSIRTQAGSESAVDLLYTFSFK
jgi:translocation and assembly module TamB